MVHTIEHMLSGHAYARALHLHFLTAASLAALILDTSCVMGEIDVRRLLYVHSSLLQCTCPASSVIQKDAIQNQT